MFKRKTTASPSLGMENMDVALDSLIAIVRNIADGYGQDSSFDESLGLAASAYGSLWAIAFRFGEKETTEVGSSLERDEERYQDIMDYVREEDETCRRRGILNDLPALVEKRINEEYARTEEENPPYIFCKELGTGRIRYGFLLLLAENRQRAEERSRQLEQRRRNFILDILCVHLRQQILLQESEQREAEKKPQSGIEARERLLAGFPEQGGNTLCVLSVPELRKVRIFHGEEEYARESAQILDLLGKPSYQTDTAEFACFFLSEPAENAADRMNDIYTRLGLSSSIALCSVGSGSEGEELYLCEGALLKVEPMTIVSVGSGGDIREAFRSAVTVLEEMEPAGTSDFRRPDTVPEIIDGTKTVVVSEDTEPEPAEFADEPEIPESGFADHKETEMSEPAFPEYDELEMPEPPDYAVTEDPEEAPEQAAGQTVDTLMQALRNGGK